GNMKFMLNGALTLGTMDGANVEIVEEVGEENAVIFGLSAEEVMAYEKNGGYNPRDIYNNDYEIRTVVTQLINGQYSPENPDLFRNLYESLLDRKGYDPADRYFILKDFKSYADAQKRIEAKYLDTEGWARSAILNVAHSGKFSSDRTIEEYAKEIWHLDKLEL
ncbi:MAG: glycogen/starch/alpha-glucan phosphorylase, partial [Lachnospiraceae bacterium]|nr:glycogen/starch/alpha-glucan phosphorylase [Lachnospiraceae bacterium]